MVEWHRFPEKTGIYLTNTRRWNEYLWVRTAETMLPSFAQPPDIYQDADREKFFPRVGSTKWVVPTDDRSCILLGWRHFSDELDLGGKGDRSRVGDRPDRDRAQRRGRAAGAERLCGADRPGRDHRPQA